MFTQIRTLQGNNLVPTSLIRNSTEFWLFNKKLRKLKFVKIIFFYKERVLISL